MKKIIAMILMMSLLTAPVSGDAVVEPLVDTIYVQEVVEEVSEEIVIEEVAEPIVIEEVSEDIVIEEIVEPTVVEEVFEEVTEPIVIEEVSEELPIDIPEEIDVEDLTRISDKTPEELAAYMHPETRHLAEDVIRICEEYGVNAEFIAAVMRWERRPDLHNWFGWTGSNGRLMTFESDIECLETVIPRIHNLYLEEDGCYYNGATVDGVSIFYNNSEFWRDTIAAEIARMM